MTGNDVRYLQYKLNITADGSFGPATTTAVKAWQKSRGLTVDGSVGPATQSKMGLTDFIVHIYDKKDVWFAGTPYAKTPKPLKTLKQWAKDEGAKRTYNLAFFNMSGANKGATISYLRAKGVDVGYGGTAEKLQLATWENVCSGWKIGIKNGLRQSVSNVGKRCRNANGQLKDGSYFHVQSVMTNTEKELVDYMMQNYIVDLLLIQDAGGSTGCYDAEKDVHLAGEKEGVNGRAVASVVCVKDEPKNMTPPSPQPKLCPTCKKPL